MALDFLLSFASASRFSILIKGLSIENKLLIAASNTILDLAYKRESQSILDPKLALKSAPPRANPFTLVSAAISEIFLIDNGVSNKAITFISGSFATKALSCSHLKDDGFRLKGLDICHHSGVPLIFLLVDDQRHFLVYYNDELGPGRMGH